jgi:preprotein translocase subunit SecD
VWSGHPRPGMPALDHQTATPMKTALLSLLVALLASACSQKPEPTATSGTPQFSVSAGDIITSSVEVVAGRVLASPTQETAVVHIEFSKARAEAFRKFTNEHVDQKVQIVVGTNVVSEPVIRTEIPGGKIEVHFSSPEEARAFAASLSQK